MFSIRSLAPCSVILCLFACAGVTSEDSTFFPEGATASDGQELISMEWARVAVALRGPFELAELPHNAGSGDIHFDGSGFVSTFAIPGSEAALSARGTVTLSRQSSSSIVMRVAYSLGMDGLIPEGSYRAALKADGIELTNISVTPGLSGERSPLLYAGKVWKLRRPACGARGLPSCSAGYFCQFPSAPMGNEFASRTCGRADIAGTCQPLPQACSAVDARVCACDGLVYRNACEARLQGMSVDFAFMVQPNAPDRAKPPIGMPCGRDM